MCRHQVTRLGSDGGETGMSMKKQAILVSLFVVAPFWIFAWLAFGQDYTGRYGVLEYAPGSEACWDQCFANCDHEVWAPDVVDVAKLRRILAGLSVEPVE